MHAPSSRTVVIRVLAAALVLVLVSAVWLGPVVVREVRARMSHYTVEDRLAQFGPRIELLWRERFMATNSDWPKHVTIVINKEARELWVFGRVSGKEYELAKYAVTAASGGPGPKSREGDKQVPEGVYRVESLNPNSRFHLALRVDYPSAADTSAAVSEGRDVQNLGGDIMIHGGAASIGCVAIGDAAIEEVFWLVGTVGIENVEIVMVPDWAPVKRIDAKMAPWLAERYRELEGRLRELGIGR